MEEEWKEALKERSQTMVDGVAGVVLSLGAYVLMSVPVVDWSQFGMLLAFFSMVVMVTLFVWYIAAEAFALRPYDTRLFWLSILLVALLVPLPFSIRLVLFSEIKGLAATFLLINTGVVFAFTTLINLLALRSPEIRLAPKPVQADLQAQKIGLLAGSLTAFLSLLLPPEGILGGPFAAWNIPVRAVGLFWSFSVFFWVLMVASMFVRKRIPASADKSPEVEKMGRIFHSKMRAVNNTMFQMAMGLSIFTLIDLPVKVASDLVPPLVHFAFLFILIVVFWNKLFRVYAAVPTWEEGIDFGTYWVAFFVALIPPAFRLAVLPEPETGLIGSTFFSILIVLLALSNTALYLYVARLLRREMISPEIAKEFRRWAAGSLILASIFLASLLIPFEVTTLWDIPLRVIVWWVSLVIFVAISGSQLIHRPVIN